MTVYPKNCQVAQSHTTDPIDAVEGSASNVSKTVGVIEGSLTVGNWLTYR